jgi:hypothetical protein
MIMNIPDTTHLISQTYKKNMMEFVWKIENKHWNVFKVFRDGKSTLLEGTGDNFLLVDFAPTKKELPNELVEFQTDVIEYLKSI